MKRKIFSVFLVLAAMIPLASAETKKEGQTRFFRISFGNDTFVNTDRGFTHGAKITWMSNDIQNYRKNLLLRMFSFTKGPGSIHTFSISLGQNIYTPDNIETTEPIENDRPYAGYLYLGFGIHSRNLKQQDTFEIDIGIVGRHAFAEETQKIIHYIFSHEDPLGWKHQLKDEFAFQTIYERKWRAYRTNPGRGARFELIPHFGAGLGNVYIYANAGYQIRFGWNLPDDFGVDLPRPGGDTNVGINHQTDSSFYLYAALDGQAIYRDIFLDGNTIVDSPRVDKYPFAASILTGFGLHIKHTLITFAYVFWTKKFKTENHSHKFGVLNISFFF